MAVHRRLRWRNATDGFEQAARFRQAAPLPISASISNDPIPDSLKQPVDVVLQARPAATFSERGQLGTFGDCKGLAGLAQAHASAASF